MSQHSSQSLGDSWEVNANVIDDGEISWAEDDPDSEDNLTQSQSHSSPPPPLVLSTSSLKAKPISSRKVVASGSQTIPQFVMPSIEATGQPRQRVVPMIHSASNSPRGSKLRPSGTRSIPQPTRNRVEAIQGNAPFTGQALAILGGIFWTIVEVVVDALKLLKKPISWIIAGYAVLVFVQLAQNLLTNSIYAALSPICKLPGSSFLDLPMCRSYEEGQARLTAGGDMPDPEFDALMKVQGQFEAIMDDTATGLSLPTDMKRSETSIRDLRQVVRFSQLPSKNELLHEFDGFVETARIASYDLQKFNSHVGRGVDIVLSTAKWTSRVLDDMAQQREERGILPAFISDTILAPFKPLKFTESRLLDQYIQHTHIVSGEIEQLIDEAQTLLQVLQNLEDRLDVIHSISVQDDVQVRGTKDEILADLWTYVGGNRAKQRKVDRQMDLLAQVSRYRRVAFSHVANTVIKLQGMGAELEELRSRVGSAAALKEAGMNHVPLAVHIENIQLGVERLEIGRQRARELEQKHQRRILDKTDMDRAGEIKYISAS